MKKILLPISLLLNVVFMALGAYFSILIEKENFKAKEMALANIKSRSTVYSALPKDSGSIIFLGNSIIDQCEWSELFDMPNIKNRGISGDDIAGVMSRIDDFIDAKPKKIFLLIGTNDLGNGRSVNEILSDYDRLLSIISKRFPAKDLYIHSLLPTYNDPSRDNKKILVINEGISKISSKYSANYIDLFSLFKSKDNALDKEYSFDGLHINGKGYLLWKKAIYDHVTR